MLIIFQEDYTMVAKSKNTILPEENGNRKLNNAMRKALAVIAEKQLSIVKGQREAKRRRVESEILEKAKKKLGHEVIVREIDILRKKIDHLKVKLGNFGFNEDGDLLTGYHRGEKYIAFSKTPASKLIEAARGKEEDAYTLQACSLQSDLWLAGTVGEARKLLSDIN
jgi:pyruvate/oxaloacetate carboxyltransferase